MAQASVFWVRQVSPLRLAHLLAGVVCSRRPRWPAPRPAPWLAPLVPFGIYRPWHLLSLDLTIVLHVVYVGLAAEL